MKYTYPHTIENGSGESLTFIRRVTDSEGTWLEVENTVQPGHGPPLHVHHFQEECLTVVRGNVGVEVPGRPNQMFGPGDTLLFKKGETHRFWNAGDEPLVCKGYIKPADNVEYFLGQIFLSTKQNGGKRPTAFDGAWLSTKYASEFELMEIPAFVKKVVFPLIVIFGTMTGKHKKFEGAPEPRRV